MVDSKDLINYGKAVAIGAGICLVFFAGTVIARRAGAAETTPRYQTPLGDQLPEAALTTLDGRPVSLKSRIGGKPALIYVFGPSECASCSNLPLEFKVVHNEAPNVRTILVASGAAASAFGTTIHDMGLEADALLDEQRVLVRAMGLEAEPVVFFADSSGRVLLVDTRGASRAAQYPMGHLLRAFAGALSSK